MRTLQSAKYEETIFDCAMELVGGGGFTAKDMSEKCGIKLTQHLRKRLRQLVTLGQLQAVHAYTERGNLATYYIKPIPKDDMTQQALPF